MTPRKFSHTTSNTPSFTAETFCVCVACLLVVCLFGAMTVGRSWFGMARPEGRPCLTTCR